MMIALEARAPALNRLRSWSLAADQDLFGRWQAVVTFGRIGRRGQARRHAFEDEVDLSRFVRRALLRRRSATQRIGGSYEAVEASPSVLPIPRNSASQSACRRHWMREDSLRVGSRGTAHASDRWRRARRQRKRIG
jgi:predicted DNA-binding WGR domain protein